MAQFEPPSKSLTRTLGLAFSRPMRILFLSPSISIFYLYCLFFHGWCNVLFTTIGVIFQTVYKFSTPQGGLTYLGLGIGGLVCVSLFGHVGDWVVRLLATRSNGTMKAYFRLPPMIAVLEFSNHYIDMEPLPHRPALPGGAPRGATGQCSSGYAGESALTRGRC
jgi:hypothetical protein